MQLTSRSPLIPYTTLFRSVTLHGFSVNLCPQLSHFSGIVPCGIADSPVTSLAELGVKDHARFDLEIGRSTRLNSSHMSISYAVFCLKKKKNYLYRVE